jgi:hypothetical protein
MLRDDIHQEKVKLVRATFGSKLGKKISDEILMPILNQLDEDTLWIMEQSGSKIAEFITDFIESQTPSGRTYKIYDWNPSAPRGHRLTLIDEYTASAPGEPPAQLEGALAQAIGYELHDSGYFKVGLVDPYTYGGERIGSELESTTYQYGKILKGPADKSTPVGTYGRALEGGFFNVRVGVPVRREWFQPLMDHIRSDIRKMIREACKKALRKATRKISVRRAVVFKIYFS